ncbi:MAG: Nucleoside-diphosphate-sugar epimerase [Candidatus Nitrotoga sp. LAW]|nr:MAG: Nucleoside-diphosphate-sugar epimerase [Candidatus Nitrotoga sp. LAW]
MKRILIIGCGDIAMRVAHLLSGHYRLFGLLRNTVRFAELRAAGITPLPGDLDNVLSLRRLTGLAHTVLHFAPPPNIGESDTRTRNLLAVLSRGTLPENIIYISTSGVYGDCAGKFVTETHKLNAQTARAQRRVDAENKIRSWAKRAGVRAIILRVPGIYAADRLPLQRLRQGTPAIMAAEDSHTNHIHGDDLARIVTASLRHAKPNRVYHTSDDSELKMGDYFDSVADAFGLPHVPRISREQAQQTLPKALLSFTNESRRLTNTRMKRELKIILRYPTVADALKTVQKPNPDS